MKRKNESTGKDGAPCNENVELSAEMVNCKSSCALLRFFKYEQTGEIRFALPTGIVRPTEIERENRPSPGTLKVNTCTVELEELMYYNLAGILKWDAI